MIIYLILDWKNDKSWKEKLRNWLVKMVIELFRDSIFINMDSLNDNIWYLLKKIIEKIIRKWIIIIYKNNHQKYQSYK